MAARSQERTQPPRIDTKGAGPGSYTVTAHVTDPKANKNNEASCSANYTVKPLPPKNPPTMSLSASPTNLVTGGSVNLSATCTSPDSVPVSVASWTSSAGTVSGSGSSATLNTAGAPAGPVTVTATCTDSRGLTAQGSTQVTLENPPPPPVNPEVVKLEARLALPPGKRAWRPGSAGLTRRSFFDLFRRGLGGLRPSSGAWAGLAALAWAAWAAAFFSRASRAAASSRPPQRSPPRWGMGVGGTPRPAGALAEGE